MAAVLITIEGTDGSGKQTQCSNIAKYFEDLGLRVLTISFPQYDKDSSHFVKNYLNGDYGDIDSPDINEYGGSLFYAMDRYISYITDWKKNIRKYDIIIFDRYVESNLIHQGARINSIADMIRYVDWETDLEYTKLGLPKPDITLFLNMPPEASELLRKHRKNKITNEDKQDIHESDKSYQLKSYRVACVMSDMLNWTKIDCVNKDYVKTLKDIKNIDEITNLCIEQLLTNSRIKRLVTKSSEK